ncbi:MAG: hypothetical protein PHV34_09775 [Verrucomicrobiae bacterium]|nr:hypothetical protein [Verrucomicrobiae bacterium]
MKVRPGQPQNPWNLEWVFQIGKDWPAKVRGGWLFWAGKETDAGALPMRRMDGERYLQLVAQERLALKIKKSITDMLGVFPPPMICSNLAHFRFGRAMLHCAALFMKPVHARFYMQGIWREIFGIQKKAG